MYKAMPVGPVRRLVNVMYPGLCPVCGALLAENEPGFCPKCAYQLPRIRYDSFTNNPVCEKLAGKVRFNRAAAWLMYEKESAVQMLSEQFKYSGSRLLAKRLGTMAGDFLSSLGFFDGIDILLPVPLHGDRMEKRGYNQSEWIARGVSEVTGLPVDTMSVCRQSATSTQTHKHYWERQENMSGVFTLTDPADTDSEDIINPLSNRHILIIDDIITTGATLASCGSAVWRAKPSFVSFMTLAMA